MVGTHGKTIQIFMPQGEPRGIRIAEFTNDIVQAILVPRSKLPEAAERDELSRPGVYFLFGEPEDAAKPVVYIGQTGDCYVRFGRHIKDSYKDFWRTAVAIVFRTDNYTTAHMEGLERDCIKKAREIGRFKLANDCAGRKAPVSESMRADLEDTFSKLGVLLSALGFPLFEPSPMATGSSVFTVRGRDCEGRGQQVEEGFLVFAGSRARKVFAGSKEPKWIPLERQQMIDKGVLVDDGAQLVFKENHVFNSPSAAAMFLLGRSANGWGEWKSPNGTLTQVEAPNRKIQKRTRKGKKKDAQ